MDGFRAPAKQWKDPGRGFCGLPLRPGSSGLARKWCRNPLLSLETRPKNGVSVDAVTAPGLDPGPTRGASAVERRLLAAGRQA